MRSNTRRSFAETIKQALEAVGYKDKKDNERFKAALMDLSDGFASESRYLISAADDVFFQICSRAVNCLYDQIGSIKNMASTHLQRGVFRTSKSYADVIADQTVEGGFYYIQEEVKLQRVRKQRQLRAADQIITVL